jgi:hypothetical protein
MLGLKQMLDLICYASNATLCCAIILTSQYDVSYFKLDFTFTSFVLFLTFPSLETIVPFAGPFGNLLLRVMVPISCVAVVPISHLDSN